MLRHATHAAVLAAGLGLVLPRQAEGAPAGLEAVEVAPAALSPANGDGDHDEALVSFQVSTSCSDNPLGASGGPGRYFAAAGGDMECRALVTSATARDDLLGRWLVDVVPAADPSALPVRTFDGEIALASGSAARFWRAGRWS